jgi:hypothetical protein
VKPAVLNASPLIVLARAGYLDLVPKLVSSVMIPHARINSGLGAAPAPTSQESHADSPEPTQAHSMA